MDSQQNISIMRLFHQTQYSITTVHISTGKCICVCCVHTVEIMMSIYALHTVQTPQDSPISLIQYLHTCCSPGSTIMELTNRRVQSVHSTVLIRLRMPREMLK